MNNWWPDDTRAPHVAKLARSKEGIRCGHTRQCATVWTMALARALELALSIPIRVSIQRLRGVRGSEVAGLTRGSRQRWRTRPR